MNKKQRMTPERLERELAESYAERQRLAREIDVALHGEEGAATQASLCDLIHPARDLRSDLAAERALNGKLRSDLADSKWRERKWSKAAKQWMNKYDAMVSKYEPKVGMVCAAPSEALEAERRKADAVKGLVEALREISVWKISASAYLYNQEAGDLSDIAGAALTAYRNATEGNKL